MLNFHGGGFVLGSSRQCDWSCSIVADELDAIVVSVDYRLARRTAIRQGWWTASTLSTGWPSMPPTSAVTRAGSA